MIVVVGVSCVADDVLIFVLSLVLVVGSVRLPMV
jgi:hypothetical protein